MRGLACMEVMMAMCVGHPLSVAFPLAVARAFPVDIVVLHFNSQHTQQNGILENAHASVGGTEPGELLLAWSSVAHASGGGSGTRSQRRSASNASASGPNTEESWQASRMSPRHSARCARCTVLLVAGCKHRGEPGVALHAPVRKRH